MSKEINYSLGNPNLKLEFFPEPLQALTKEIYNHPALLQILHNQADKDVYMQLCEIAAYCDVVLEGDYSRDDVIRLAEKLTWDLKKKGSALILPNSFSEPDVVQ